MDSLLVLVHAILIVEIEGVAAQWAAEDVVKLVVKQSLQRLVGEGEAQVRDLENSTGAGEVHAIYKFSLYYWALAGLELANTDQTGLKLIEISAYFCLLITGIKIYAALLGSFFPIFLSL